MNTLALALQEYRVKEGFGTADFHGVTTLHPLGLVAIVILGIACLSVPRRWAPIPFLISACFVSAAQRVVIATLDFNVLRLLVLAGWMRLLMRQEYRGFRWCRLDTIVTAWALVSTAIYITLHGTVPAAIHRAGYAYDFLGLYLFFRCAVRTWGDVDLMVRSVAILAVPIALIFAEEKLTGRNAFSFLGGVPEITIVRQGRLRAQGPFTHAILAGSFFAAWLPLVLSLYWRRDKRVLGISGTIAILGIVVMCASSTPVGGVVAVMVGTLFWHFRHNMRAVRWGIAGALVGLHIVMKAPIWHLISRISFSRGSTSYHRYLLIDNAISHFNEWALLGSKDTSHWGPQMFDLTNQFVAEGVKGGALGLVLFVGVFAVGFGLVGRIWRQVRHAPYPRRLGWSLGVSLFVHATMFLSISISYSQQNLMVFFFVLASIGSLATAKSPSRSPARTARPRELAVASASSC